MNKLTNPVPAGFLTRGDLIKRLGISERHLMKLLREGTIKAARHTHHRWALYSIADADRVHRVLTTRLRRTDLDAVTFTADEAVEVFKRLQQGIPLESIMVELKMHPYMAQAIRSEYVRISGSMTLSRSHVDRLNRLPLEGVTLPLASADDIVLALETAYADKRCMSCRRRARSTHCAACVVQKHVKSSQPSAVSRQPEEDETSDAEDSSTAAADRVA